MKLSWFGLIYTKEVQKFAKKNDKSRVLPRCKINDGNDLMIR